MSKTSEYVRKVVGAAPPLSTMQLAEIKRLINTPPRQRTGPKPDPPLAPQPNPNIDRLRELHEGDTP